MKKIFNKGFTLIELLAVISLIALVLVITVPNFLKSNKKFAESSFESTIKAFQRYIDTQITNCISQTGSFNPNIFKENTCKLDDSNNFEKLLNASGYGDMLAGIKIDLNTNTIIEAEGKGTFADFKYLTNSNNFDFIEKPDISSIGLIPIKYDETKSKWIVTSENDSEWYDYYNQKWANAAILTESGKAKNKDDELDLNSDVYAMFVWIPRYSYTIGCTDSSSCLGYKVETDETSLSSTTPGAIDIKFVSKSTKETYQNSETSGTAPTYTYSTTYTEEERIAKREEAANWYTHPAFWWDKNCNNIWDKDENLSGIWIGKFETTGNEMIPMILPNATSLIGKNVSKQFEIAQKFRNDTSTYGLIGGISHMMKNSEWGAVAYLSQSIYGKYGNPNYEGANKEIYINNSSDMYTGRSGGTPSASFEPNGTYKYDDTPTSGGEKVNYTGTGASTTGNIYGIYDMSGGAWEYVMGNYNDGANQITGSSGFGTEEKPWPAKNYFDAYKTTTPFAKKDETTNGGALAETYNWYGDYSSSFINGKVWLNRGGVYSNLSNAGVFYGSTNTGSSSSAGSFRVSFISAS